MGKEWLGRRIDDKFIADLRKANSTVDACGENGEFHTFVTDGPIFKKKMRITRSDPFTRKATGS